MRLPHPRYVGFFAVFAVCTLASSRLLSIEEATILGFDLAAAAFILTCLPLWHGDRVDAARARAARDDGGRFFLLVSAVAVIAAILLALGRLVGGRNTLTGVDFAAVAGTLVLAWLFFNLIYAFHYAHLYYDQHRTGDAGGIIFPEGGEPVFADFVYFAFVIGMTCQTADLDISARAIRRVVTGHGVLAFFFNLGVLAMTINVLSGVI
ncbi:DUF1345 domain-containing protein [Paracoccus subflavus]|uniref:DUF1345 domain-containing protein n=1 Tax=Paracoccus subflavus TaxID=2528244 RepID=A0A4Q9G6L2_9RHOB|nr:DUF1345 domain-containing protein [Paracoccus subflavus]TBN43670.1 DUF1345 domain-containing protein [Paracoccus subflavus]